MVAAAAMPVPPSSTSIGRYSYSPSYSSYRPSSYLNRTTSLDRSNYGTSTTTNKESSTTSYSGYSTYTSKYSRPPRPSYSSTTDTYRSSRSCRVSPVRNAYSSRIGSDSKVSSKDSSNNDSKYSSRYIRDSSVSKDSGYGSRLTSRDRSVDIVNGNGIDVSSFGPSPSSYAFNYRWDGRHFGKPLTGDDGGLAPIVTGLLAGKEAEGTADEEEKIKVSDRIRNFEPKSSIVSDAREHELESISIRRRRLGLSPARETKSRTPQPRKTSPEQTSRTIIITSNSNENTSNERRPSVTELCRKYDTNHNMSNGVTKSDEEEPSSNINNFISTSPKEEALRAASPLFVNRNRRRHDSNSKSEQRDSPSLPKDIVSSRLDSPAKFRHDSPAHVRLDSPVSTYKDSSAKSRLESPVPRSDSPARKERDETSSSILLNGTADKVSVK